METRIPTTASETRYFGIGSRFIKAEQAEPWNFWLSHGGEPLGKAAGRPDAKFDVYDAEGNLLGTAGTIRAAAELVA